MEVTRELLLAKKAELQKAYNDAQAQATAFGGALQFVDHLLELLNTPETKDADGQNLAARIPA